VARVTYLGHAAFYIEGEGIKALIDPFLSGNPSSAWKPASITDLNYIFVTHGHDDHIGDTVQIAKKYRCNRYSKRRNIDLFSLEGTEVSQHAHRRQVCLSIWTCQAYSGMAWLRNSRRR